MGNRRRETRQYVENKSFSCCCRPDCAAGRRGHGAIKSPPEEVTATAIVNNNLGSGAGCVIMQVKRWSSEAEGGQLTRTLMKDGPNSVLDQLRDMKSVGSVRTLDSLGYDLRDAHREAERRGRSPRDCN